MLRIRPRLSYANIMATVAMFVALGGTSYAALTITGANIKDGTIKSADVANGGLTGTDIKDNSLGLEDVSAGAEASLHGAAGAAGAAGATGAPGAPGADGQQGPAGSPDTGAQIRTKLGAASS